MKLKLEFKFVENELHVSIFKDINKCTVFIYLPKIWIPFLNS